MRQIAMVTLGAVLLSSTVLSAEGCPPAPDHSAALEQLLERVGRADSEQAARALSDQMWALWTDAPDEAAQALLDRGMQARASYDFLGATDALDRLVRYCPDYAEGYNQRAFVSYLRQDFAAALVDLDRALARSPAHVGALSGKALSHYALGQIDDARIALEAALALNPWLSERALAAPGGPLAPKGQKL